MTNLALVVNNNTEQQEQGLEYVKADTKNGFTQMANELLDHLATLDITKRQWRVMISLIRKTYGFNKKTDWIVGEQIATHMKYDAAVTHIHSDIRSLKRRKIIIEDGRKIGPNPVVSQWTLTENKPKSVTRQTNRNRSLDKPKSVTRQTEIGLNSDEKRSTQKKDTNTKDNNTKDNGKLVLPEWLPKELWLEFVAMRKLIKKPLTDQATVRMINKLVKFHDQGIDALAQLTYSIDNCYSDVYAPKNHQNNTFRAKSSPENFDDKDYGETQIPVWMQGETS